MNKIKTLTVVVALFLLYSPVLSQQIEVIKFDDLDKMLKADVDNPVIYNFWATWCGPCIKELPQFEALNKKYKSSGLKVVLVSMDFVENLDPKVKKFINKKQLKSTLYLLDEIDYNSFIDKIDPQWSGAIPATIMIDSRNNKRAFFEKEFKEGELEKTYLEFIN
ncbi:MAG: TlpA family protein disulfide reductase [Reichenbachiella sp.]